MERDKKRRNYFIIIIAVLGMLVISGCSPTSVAINEVPNYENEAVINIDWAHAKTHEGMHYYKRDYVTLTNGASVDILLITGPQEAHLLPSFIANDGGLLVEWFGEVTISNNGTLVPYFNSNNNYADDNGLTIYRNPTVTSYGTPRGKNLIGSGQKFGGEIRGNNELILKPNSKYIFRLTNQASINNVINCNFDWYDHQ